MANPLPSDADRQNPWLPLVEQTGGWQSTLRVELDLPWLEGHFPDDPILPGVAELAFAWETVYRRLTLQGASPVLLGFRQVRFRRFVRPGERLELTITPSEEAPDRLRFDVVADGEPSCQGTLVLRSTAAAPSERPA